MKKILIASLIVATTSLSGAALANSGERHERYLAHLTTALELSSEQQEQLRGIHAEQAEKYKALREESKERINAVLSSEQQAKLAELHEQRREKFKEHHQGMRRAHGDKPHNQED